MRKKVKASEVLTDIRGGMTDQALMEKYGLSEKGLDSLFKKLLDGGILKQGEMEKRNNEFQQNPMTDGEPARQSVEVSEIIAEGQQEVELDTSHEDQEPTERKRSDIGNIIELIRTGGFRELGRVYKFRIAIVACGVVAILLSYIIYREFSLPYESDLPKSIEQRVIAHYSNPKSIKTSGVGHYSNGTKLADIRVLRAVEGVPPQKIEDINPKKIYCVSFLASVLNGHLEDPLSPRVFNVIVYEARSTRLSGTVLRTNDSEKESNCPPDWDNICPFTCDSHDELVAGLREERRRASQKEQARIVAEATRKREEARVKAEREEKARIEASELLLKSALGGNRDGARSALRTGAEVNCSDNSGETPLMMFSRRGDVELVTLLIQKGASVNLRNKSGESAITLASRNGHVEVVRLLAAKGVDVDTMDGIGSTVLLHVTMANDLEMMKALLELGACPHVTNKSGNSPLSVACAKGDVKQLELLLTGHRCYLGRRELDPLMMMALKKGHADVGKLLVQKGANVNVNDGSLLCSAISENNPERVKLLLEFGADVNTRREDGVTPLGTAYETRNFGLMKFLLANGANPNTDDKTGKPLLLAAASEGRTPVVELLINHGANINSADSHQNNALIVACANRQEEVVQFLLEKGQSIEARNAKGNTPLMTACIAGSQSIVDLLLKAGAKVEVKDNDGNTPLIVACSAGNQSVVDLLLKAGARVDAKDRDGYTALMIASWRGRNECAKQLLSRGADPNCEIAGETLLIRAADRGNKDFVQMLLEHGADINARDKSHRRTALMRATLNGHVEVVRILIEKGADWGLKDASGKDALELAQSKGKEAIVALLKAPSEVIHKAKKPGR